MNPPVPTVAAVLRPGMIISYRLPNALDVEIAGTVLAASKINATKIQLVMRDLDSRIIYPELAAGHAVSLDLDAMIRSFNNTGNHEVLWATP